MFEKIFNHLALIGKEVKNKEYLALPRLSPHFDKKVYGRLNQLIEAINQA